MKRLFAMLLALTMILSLSITAFADDNTGSITITNATIGEDYSVYKLFDATYSEDAVSYTIEKNNQFFSVLFGADGTTANNFFVCSLISDTTYAVTKKGSINDTELIAYLTDIINASGATYTPAADSIEATETNVVFNNLDYGYYIIKSTLGVTVTINSNTPDVTVIDKNQQGGTSFNKEIWNESKQSWDSSNSACFGEDVKYKISFTATNYDAANQVQFYSIYDTTGAAINPNFETVTVKVIGDDERNLTKGYLIGTGDYKDYGIPLGNWGTTDPATYATSAEWYLVRSGENDFRISIPWMSNHTLAGNGTAGYSLSFGEGAVSKFASPVNVEITYEAAMGNNSTIGGASYNTVGSNNINTAHVKWYFHGGTDSTLNDTVHTYVYGIGVLKEDSTSGDNLRGAEFEVYKDKECTVPVAFTEGSINGVYNHDDGSTSNKVVSQLNGKIVLLGLKEGTYYLKEVKAPDGYNALSTAVEIAVGEGLSEDFSVYADPNGFVADTEQDKEGYIKHTYGVAKATVGNSKGVELPSTGGEGTMMLITIGAVLAMAFAVLLITHKKMSIYHD